MQMRFALIAAALALAACSTSDVAQISPGVYRVSAIASMLVGGPPAARDNAMRDAQAHCARHNEQVQVISEERVDWYGTQNLTFRCVSAIAPAQ
jgi:hypothetical protein